ncbi:MAG: uroporphyrinogen decarboxylase family protein [Planctomycetota bacterium]
MNSRERVRNIIAGEEADRCAFWLGNPDGEAWPGIHDHFGTQEEEELRVKVGDDLRWICAGFGNFPIHPTKLDDTGPWAKKTAHGDAGPFAEVDDPAALEDYPWPKAEEIDFAPVLKRLDNAGDVYRASGLWTCFYHNVMDLFGIEAYLMNMYLNPEVVHAVTDRVCQFYYEANERFFREAGDRVDAFFFGNDFGTQLDLICGPDQFDEFILPWFRKFTEQGHRHGHQVILHSCGAIHKVIDRLIDAGVDCLHPLQAKAANMDAETLARDFKGRIAFMGGIDTQDLLVNASPDEIGDEVRRVRDHLGPNLIISPSHEAILKNVPPANIEAMANAARE